MQELRIHDFEANIGYRFSDVSLLKLALTHSSYGNEIHHDRMHNNERLEFLGDAVLEITVSKYLYNRYPDVPEGELTKHRASIVCEPTLALCAKDINLSSFLLLGKGEDQTGGRFRDSITSDAMEAVLGAIYLDGGIECASRFVENHILNDIDNKKLYVDSKSILQELSQSQGFGEPNYELISEEGPDHCKKYTYDVYMGEKIVGHGEGKSKKHAQQQAAYNAITSLKSTGNN